MLRTSMLAAAIFATTLGTTAAFASPPRPTPAAFAFMPRGRTTVWTSLGEVRVGGWRNRDAALEVGRDAGRLTRLRVVVKHGDEGLKRVRVTFGNGETLDTAMSGRMAFIDLPGEARMVRSIEVRAAGFTRRDRSVVEVLGDRAERHMPPRHAFR